MSTLRFALVESHAFAAALTVLSALAAWWGAEPVADLIQPDWRRARASHGGQEPHPMLERFVTEPVLRDVNLRHTASGRFQRRPKSLFHMQGMRPRTEKLDVLFVGDSTVAWSVDPETVSDLSGLSVGHVAFESNLVRKDEAAFVDWLATCLVKPDGLIIGGWAWHFTYVSRGFDRGWNAQERDLLKALKGKSPSDGCAPFDAELNRRGEWVPPPPAWSFDGYTSRRDELDGAVWKALDVASPYLSVRLFWGGEEQKSDNEEGGIGSFFMYGDDVITRVNNYGKGIDASLRATWPDDATLTEDAALSDKDRAVLSANLGPMGPLAQRHNLCLLTMMADENDGKRLAETRKQLAAFGAFVPDACVLDMPQLVVKHTGRKKVRLQGTIHPAETTPQLFSIALGRELSTNPQLEPAQGVRRRRATRP